MLARKRGAHKRSVFWASIGAFTDIGNSASDIDDETEERIDAFSRADQRYVLLPCAERSSSAGYGVLTWLVIAYLVMAFLTGRCCGPRQLAFPARYVACPRRLKRAISSEK